MNAKKILFALISFITLLGINGCDTSVVVIDMKDKFNEEDSFDVHELINPDYALSDPLKIKVRTKAEIVKAEKVVYYYPTIWSEPGDDAYQYIYLYDLEYKDVLPLKIQDGIIEYPLSFSVRSYDDFISFFGKITKQQTLSAIQKVPEMYEQKNGHALYDDLNSWRSEKKIWERIANKYHLGEFIDEENEPFDVDPDEIELIVTFKGPNGLFTKKFLDHIIVGN